MPAPKVRQAQASQRRSMSKPDRLQIVCAHVFLRTLLPSNNGGPFFSSFGFECSGRFIELFAREVSSVYLVD
jgi:hypothetical protein